VGTPNRLPELTQWQQAEARARTAEHDCVVLYRAWRRNGGPKAPFHLYEKARELRLYADQLRRKLWGV
jgi:hypothetical protein